jgi:hypothetical protein
MWKPSLRWPNDPNCSCYIAAQSYMDAVATPFATDLGCVEISGFEFGSILSFASVPNRSQKKCHEHRPG